MPEIINRNSDIQDNAKAAFALTSEQLTKIVSDRIVPIVDLTPAISAPSTKITDGTDTCDVTSAGELEVKNNGFPIGASGQSIISLSNGGTFTNVVAGVGVNLYSVTSGKKFYMTSWIISNNNASATTHLRDGGVAGTIKTNAGVHSAVNDTKFCIFPTPLVFSTNVWVDTSVNAAIYYSITGYEE